MRAAGSEQGQVAALMIFCLIALLGLSALVIDAGVWFQAKRGLQAQVDAAALAGAQGLPDTSTAAALATQYAKANGAVGDPTITFPTASSVGVSESKPVEGIFSRVLGVLSVDVGAHAVATVKPLMSMSQAVPLSVSTTHPTLVCGQSCFGRPSQIKLGPDFKIENPNEKPDKDDSICSGECVDEGDLGFGTLLALNGGKTKKKWATLAGWIQNGYGRSMGLGSYKGLKPPDFNIEEGGEHAGEPNHDVAPLYYAIQARLGQDLLLPIYEGTVKKDGKEEQPKKQMYTVVGWVGFHLDGLNINDHQAILDGEFTRIYRDGAEGDAGQPDYSAASIDLTS